LLKAVYNKKLASSCRKTEGSSRLSVMATTETRYPADTLPLEVPGLNIRPARVSDVPAIYELIRVFADQKLMIRRSMTELYESIREYLVAVDDENRVAGCVALHVFWADLAEIRGLAVSEHVQNSGVGRQLVDACWESARELDITSVFALTQAAGFFQRCGYHAVDRAELPSRIWNECVRCPAFPECKELAFIRTAEPESGAETMVGNEAAIGR
jgi:amino-acid N-acetyltransferase